jgi:hypothetical protein
MDWNGTNGTNGRIWTNEWNGMELKRNELKLNEMKMKRY